ncbi:MAG: tRNA (adenosine(37)-N6)-dimethylallyltransferase MiaA [Candidatus Paceibacterota bacterium]|jgi:tRNA dimethylallyltransferase
MKQNPKIIVVAGPTASGKSDFAVELALKNNGEIISADSRQLYKGLDIGTGKITEEEMKGVKHHMLSVYELGEDVSVARFARDAYIILEDILSRGKTPIICGGTGQYIDALIYDTSIPHVEPNQKLRAELEKKTTEELFNELITKDPKRAEKIDKHNRVRVIRALEIINLLGHVPIQSEPKLIYDTKIYLMNPTRELLRERITKRLEKRLAHGMTDEVKSVMEKGYTSDTMKKFGLEYVTIARYLENKIDEEEMKKELITKSMQYAKRQQTWNKKYLPTAEIVSL